MNYDIRRNNEPPFSSSAEYQSVAHLQTEVFAAGTFTIAVSGIVAPDSIPDANLGICYQHPDTYLYQPGCSPASTTQFAADSLIPIQMTFDSSWPIWKDCFE